MLADTFGPPAGDDAPTLISGDRLKALFPQFKRSLRLLGNLLEEACQHTIIDFSDDLPEIALYCKTGEHCFSHSCQQCAL